MLKMIRTKAKPYFVAEIAYNPSWPEMPWHVQRTGVVAEQGGMNFGTETISFATIEEAVNYLKFAIERDMDEYKKMVAEFLVKESKK